MCVSDACQMRNRLAGTIASLAGQGVLDPHELANRALGVLGVPAEYASANSGALSHAGADG
jgi:hypothetical protein